MPRVPILRLVLNFVRSLLTSQVVQRPLRELFSLWLYIRRHLFCCVAGGPESRPERRRDTQPKRKPSYIDLTGGGPRLVKGMDSRDTGDLEGFETITICASREPRLSLQLDGEQRMLQVERTARPVSVGSYPQYEAPRHTDGMLHPEYRLSHSNASRISQDSVRLSSATLSIHDARSVSSAGEQRHSRALVGPRASARGISRVASANLREPSHSRSRSRSRVHSSRHSSVIGLHVQAESDATRSSIDVAEPTAVSVANPSPPNRIAPLPHFPNTRIWPIITIQRYDRNVIL